MDYQSDNSVPWSDEKTVATLEEGYEGKRIFPSIYDLIRRCGCRLMMKGNPNTEGFGHIGSSSVGTAQLCLTGIITIESRSLSDLAWAAHEAVHFFCGDTSFEDEAGMMVLELLLYNSVEKKRDRRELLLNLSGSYIAGTEIRDHVHECQGSDFFRGMVWDACLWDAQRLSYVDKDHNIHPYMMQRLTD